MAAAAAPTAEAVKNIDKLKATFTNLKAEIARKIMGQEEIIDQIIIAILTDSNALLESFPGLGKTTMIKAVAETMSLRFSRVQGTPDLMPSDVTGTYVIEEKDGKKLFKFQRGPLFANIVLMDEINRATPKTQAALLEAMQEKQVTVGNQTFELERPFFVLATQNPIDQEGTYPLPEAQTDRFLLKILVKYPSVEQEIAIVDEYTKPSEREALKPLLSAESILLLQKLTRQVPIANDIKRRAVEIVNKTRNMPELIEYGASPRASRGGGDARAARAGLRGPPRGPRRVAVGRVRRRCAGELIHPPLGGGGGDRAGDRRRGKLVDARDGRREAGARGGARGSQRPAVPPRRALRALRGEAARSRMGDARRAAARRVRAQRTPARGVGAGGARMTIDTEFLKALSRLDIILKKKIYADKQGEHHAPQGGQGLVFRDYKAYVPGDDFRHIDWRIYGRTDKFYIRRFESERNLTVHILVDSSASMNFGTGKHTKFEYAAEVGLGFAFIAQRNNEKFNLNTFKDHVTSFKPKRGVGNLAHLFDYMSALKVEGRSDFLQSMDEYRKRITSKSFIVFISDFLYDPAQVEEIIGRYHRSEIFMIQVLDVQERELTVSGDVILEDSETQDKMRTFVSTRFKNNYQQRLEEHIATLKGMCDRHGANFISVSTNTPIFETFYHMFR